MRVYYDDATDEISFLEGFRMGEDGNDDPSPGTYIEAPDIDFTLYNKEDWLIVDGAFVKKPQLEIDARIQAEADFEQLTQDKFDAQEKFNGRVGEAIDLILFFIDTVHSDDLLPAWKIKLDGIRADYAAWEALKD